jgi:hypothetical protein
MQPRCYTSLATQNHCYKIRTRLTARSHSLLWFRILVGPLIAGFLVAPLIWLFGSGMPAWFIWSEFSSLIGPSLSLSLMLRPTVCLGIKHPSGANDQIFISVRNTEYVWQLHSWFRGAPSLTRGRVCLLYVPLVLASAVFFGPSPLGLATVFYCLRFETSIFVASYNSEGHGGGIRPRLHTGVSWFVLHFFNIPKYRSLPWNYTPVRDYAYTACTYSNR